MKHNQGVTEGQRCFLVVDAARYNHEDFFREVYDYDLAPDWCWLFENTRLESRKHAGPIVITARVGDPLWNGSVAGWFQDHSVVVMTTQLDRDEAVYAIRTNLLLSLENWGPCFIRPYESAFLTIFQACNPRAMAHWIGAGNTLAWPSPSPGDESEWLYMEGDGVGKPQPLSFNQPQKFEQVLEWARKWPVIVHLPEVRGWSTGQLQGRIRELWKQGRPCPTSDRQLSAILNQPVETELAETHL